MKNKLGANGDITISDSTVCVDQAGHNQYNKILNDEDLAKKESKVSVERMKKYTGGKSGKQSQYNLGITVDHNIAQVEGAGSCIFIHVWEGPKIGTAGCTAMDVESMKKLYAWFDSEKDQAGLVQLPKNVYNSLVKNGKLKL